MKPLIKSIFVILPLTAVLSGCMNEDYAELCEERIASNFGAKSLDVTKNSWSKAGSSVSVVISFNAKDAKGKMSGYRGSCNIKGDKVVRFVTRSDQG